MGLPQHGGSAYGAAMPLAKSLCGTVGGLHPTRVPGPRYDVEPEIVASDPAKLFCLLSAVAYAFSFGQRHAGAQSGETAGAGARGVDSSGRGGTPIPPGFAQGNGPGQPLSFWALPSRVTDRVS